MTGSLARMVKRARLALILVAVLTFGIALSVIPDRNEPVSPGREAISSPVQPGTGFDAVVTRFTGHDRADFTRAAPRSHSPRAVVLGFFGAAALLALAWKHFTTQKPATRPIQRLLAVTGRLRGPPPRLLTLR